VAVQIIFGFKGKTWIRRKCSWNIGEVKDKDLTPETPAGVNWTRYQPEETTGHHESFFQRANHPSRPLAFWIRYTIFSPKEHPENALGELWAIYFDGETGNHVAVKKEVPLRQCTFKTSEFFVSISDSSLEPGRLRGSAASGSHTISWDLGFGGGETPLFLLPLKSYGKRLPKAKALVGLPMAMYNGSISVDGEDINIVNWIGSQNHNWGSKHTDYYAWGQVAGFESHPDSFLEVISARFKVGPFWTPVMTLLVLRHKGEEIALNGLIQSIRATASINYFNWDFESETDRIRIEGMVSARREDFVGLKYYNPPGGIKYCLNSKIASCELRITHKQSNRVDSLSTRHRAAFEILTDDQQHGVTIRN
jgi:hypothetical protein